MSNQVREVVAVFDDAEQLENAVFDLQTHGFDRAAVSLLASEDAVERKLGHRYERIDEMEDEPGAPRETFFSKVSLMEAEYGLAPALAFIGAVAVGFGSSAITLPLLVAAGSGFAVGAALGRIIHEHHAKLLREQIERGGLLMWVSVHNPEEARKATDVLQASGGRHVHTHTI